MEYAIASKNAFVTTQDIKTKLTVDESYKNRQCFYSTHDISVSFDSKNNKPAVHIEKKK